MAKSIRERLCQFTDPLALLHECNRLLSECLSTSDSATLLYFRAAALWMLGRLSEALAACDEALGVQSDVIARGKLLCWKASILYDMGNTPAFRHALEDVFALNLPNTDEAAVIRATAATHRGALLALQLSPEAFEWFENGETMFREAGSPQNVAWAQSEHIALALRLERPDEAETVLVRHTDGDPRTVALYKAHILHLRGEDQECERLIERLEKQEFGALEPRHAGYAHYLRGRMALRQENPFRCAKHLTLALDEFERDTRKRSIGLVLDVLDLRSKLAAEGRICREAG